MAHLANPDRSYYLLQQRLDRNVTGAPDSPAFTQILKLLFSPEDAEIARQMPTTFVSVEPAGAQTGDGAGRAGRPLDPHGRAGAGAGRGAPRQALRHPLAGGDRLLRVHLHAPGQRPAPGRAGAAVRRVLLPERPLRALGVHGRDADRPLAGARGGAGRRRSRRDPGLGAGQPPDRDAPRPTRSPSAPAATTTATWARPATGRSAPA